MNKKLNSLTPHNHSNRLLVAGAGGFLGKYVMRELSDRHLTDVDTLGLKSSDSVVCDLIHDVPELPYRYETVINLVGTCRKANAGNVNIATVEHLLAALDAALPREMVYVSSVEVYGRTEGEGYTEETIPAPESVVGRAKLRTEEVLAQWCTERGVKLTILRCPPIVGTGMEGPLRSLVNSIYRGTYHHIDDETSRVSVVHAVDVARAIVDLAPIGGLYNFTDGVDPTRHDLAEAFAFRLQNKRIYTLRARRARMTARIADFIPFAGYGTAKLAERYRSLTYSSDKAAALLRWRPNSVTDYLRTHNYDENSL